MLLDIKKVFQNVGETLEVDHEVSMQNVEIDGIYPFKAPVKIKAIATNKASLVGLDIITEFNYVRPCDRCLETVDRVMSYKFNHKLAVELNNDDSDDYIQAPDFKIDIDELVTTDIILQLPSKYLCSEGCRGLCPSCGQNLNNGDCGCNDKQIDSRLEQLKQLLE